MIKKIEKVGKLRKITIKEINKRCQKNDLQNILKDIKLLPEEKKSRV